MYMCIYIYIYRERDIRSIINIINQCINIISISVMNSVIIKHSCLCVCVCVCVCIYTLMR